MTAVGAKTKVTLSLADYAKFAALLVAWSVSGVLLLERRLAQTEQRVEILNYRMEQVQKWQDEAIEQRKGMISNITAIREGIIRIEAKQSTREKEP